MPVPIDLCFLIHQGAQFQLKKNLLYCSIKTKASKILYALSASKFSANVDFSVNYPFKTTRPEAAV